MKPKDGLNLKRGREPGILEFRINPRSLLAEEGRQAGWSVKQLI